MNQSAWNSTTSSSVNTSALMTSMAPENVSVEDGENRFFAPPSSYMFRELLRGCSFAVGSVGSVANGFVLLALLCARQNRQKNINVFIMNQTFLDLLSCLFLILSVLSGRFESPSVAGKWIVCLLFQSNTVVAVASYSSIFGLMVITVERYVKIVHPVTHRNHYRPWMTTAGVILPWIDGVCCYLIPAWATATMGDGKCRWFHWPIPALYSAYTLTMFIWHYVVPPTVFIFAYYKIIGVIRGQQRAVGPAAPPSASTAVSVQTAGTRAGQGEAKQKRKVNVVRTMVIIIICFCICYLPYKVYLYHRSAFNLTCLTTSTTLHQLAVVILFPVFSSLVYSACNLVSTI